MNINKSALQRTFTALLRLTALSCAALMLCVVPLYFDNAFFNINRCKVNLMLHDNAVVCAAAAVFFIGTHAFNGTNRMEKLFPSDIAMLLFLIACTVSWRHAGIQRECAEWNQRQKSGVMADVVPWRGILCDCIWTNRWVPADGGDAHLRHFMCGLGRS